MLTEPVDREVIERYRRRYRRADAFYALLGALRGIFFISRRSDSIPQPKRILLANYGHLGDIVMSTACVSILKAALPEAKIGFMLGSRSRPVLDGHPDIERLHVIDHWFMERGPGNRFAKMRRYRQACREMADQLSSVGYDLAIDLRAHFPNAVSLLHRAGIPLRIGYSCLGQGPLLTHPRRFEYHRQHESVVQSDLLRVLELPEELFASPRFKLPAPTAVALDEAKRFLSDAGLDRQSYRVMHVGAGAAAKDWPQENWRALASRLANEARRIIFTGRGERDRRLIASVILGLEHCVSACDRLNWAALVEIIRGAELVYTVDTMAGHIAAAVGTPCVEIHGGMSDYRQWGPRPGPTTEIVKHVVPCWPCFQYNGCEHMSCLRLLDVDQVIESGERVIGRGKDPLRNFA